MNIDLEQLRVLITRPKPGGEVLRSKLTDFNAIVWHLPTIEIVHHENFALPTSLDELDWLIFTSRAAVNSIQEKIQAQWPQFPPSIRVAAVGEKTAQTLDSNYFPKVVYPKENWSSEGLLDLPEFAKVTDQAIALVKGEGGRAYLKEELLKKGASVFEWNVYRRILPTVTDQDHLFKRETIDVVVATSLEGINNLLTLKPKEAQLIKNTPLLVSSPRLQESARSIGFNQVYLAKNAGEDAIILGLREILIELKENRMVDENVAKPNKASRAIFFRNIAILISGISAFILIIAMSVSALEMVRVNHRLANWVNQLQGKLIESTQTLAKLQEQATSSDTNNTQITDELKKHDELLAQLNQAGDTSNAIRNVSEAQYLIKLANTNLLFERDLGTAINLLEVADKNIAKLNDPQLYPVRQAITQDLVELKSIPQVDTTGIYLRLLALDGELEKLPLAITPITTPEAKATNEQTPLPWWKQALSVTGQSLKTMVVVRHNNNPMMPFITPEQQAFLSQNLHANMQKAEWGLLHRNAKIYQSSLAELSQWITKYVAEDSTAKKQLLTSLQQLQQINIEPTLPNLNRSLAALQTYLSSNINKV